MGVRLLVRSCWASGSDGDAVFEFDQTRITLGRGRGADVRLPHRAVSIRHATIEHSGSGYALVDHDTTNGTTVQGVRVVSGRSKPLRDGDRIELGGFTIVFLSSVPVTTVTSLERTASLARRLARDSLDVDADALQPTLIVLNGPSEGKRVPLPDAPATLVLGRGETCDLPLEDADLSREHAAIEVALDGVRVRDLASKNGVWLGERRIEERFLADRDELRIGSTVVRFEDPAAGALAGLEDGDDASVEPPRYQTPEPALPEPAPEAPEPSEAPPPAPRPKGESVAPADMLIYVLASVVFAVSILGLIWLLRSG